MKITIREYPYEDEIDISGQTAIALSIAIMAQKDKISEDTEKYMAFDELEKKLTELTNISKDEFINTVHHYIDVFTSK